MQYLLDTNVLRNIVVGKDYIDLQKEIQTFKTTEKSKDCKFLFCNVVCIELISHLIASDNAKNECLNALKYKVELCGDFTTNERVKGLIVPELNELLSIYFFGKKSQHYVLNNHLVVLSHEISSIQNLWSSILLKSQIAHVILYKETELKNIIINIENHFIKNFSESNDWSVFKNSEKLKNEFKSLLKKKIFHKLFSLSLINLAFENEPRLELSGEEFKMFNSDFFLSIDFFIENIWKKFLDIGKIEYLSNPSIDPKQRWNSYYDTQIIMACEFENSRGRETKLVTAEKKIINHFKKHKREGWIMSYQDFDNKILN